MSQRLCVLVLLAFGSTLAGAEASDPARSTSGELGKLRAAKLEAVRRVFEGFWRDKTWRSVEAPYRWSRRWLEAQRQLSERQADQVAAFRQHLDRMRELRQISRRDFRGRLGNVNAVHATEHYVTEAAEWLARATTRGPRSVRKR
jgi:hypothetical protein